MFELSIINYDKPLYNRVVCLHCLSSVYRFIEKSSQFFYNVLLCKDVQFIIKKV